MKTTRSKTVEVDVDIEIDIDDVMEFIEDASESDLKQVAEAVAEYVEFDEIAGFESGTLDNDEKIELLRLAAEKYTLTELEQRLGTKFDLQ